MSYRYTVQYYDWGERTWKVYMVWSTRTEAEDCASKLAWGRHASRPHVRILEIPVNTPI